MTSDKLHSSDDLLPADNSEAYYFPSWSTLRIVGPDAASWLHGIATGNVKSVKPGHGCWSSLLTKQGKVQADLQIVGSESELFLAVSGGEANLVRETLDGYLVMEDAEIEASDKCWVVGLGAASSNYLESLNLLGGRVGWSGLELSVWLVEGDLRRQLSARSPVLSDDEFASWCIRHGVPRYGVDYSLVENLHAASLERRTVDWSKGCYLGQEVVCMQDMRGKVKQRLVHLSGTDFMAAPGDLVFDSEGVELGRVTSSTHGIAIASVRAAGYEPGTQLIVGSTPVSVSALR